jgi:hypothetical protein
MRLLIVVVYFAALAGAQSLPQIGEMLDPAGSLRPVFGVAGNFMTGPARNERVLSAACSAQLCLAKTDTKILSPSGSVAAPAGPALIAIQGDSVLVYFQLSETLVRWHDNVLEPLNWNVKGTPLSIRAAADGVDVAVRRANQVWLARSDGAAVARIPDATGPVMLLADGTLLVVKQSLVLRRPNTQDLRFDLPGVEALSALGEHYVQVRAGGTLYALRTEPDREQLYLLPGNAPLAKPQATGVATGPLPPPILDVGSAPLASAQQRTLTMSLPSPSPFTASGLVSLTFQPDSTLIADDPYVTFAVPVTRVLPFSVILGGTQVMINGQPGAVFQTGATSGRILVTLTGIVQGISGDPTTVLTIPPSHISLDTATATILPGELDVSLIGLDNTLTAGAMTFTFRDVNGLPIGSAVQANFTSQFNTYFKTAADGAFQALVAFSVKGNAASIISVEVDLVNNSGTTSTNLVFQ